MDNNDIVLDEVTKVLFTIGVKYRKADINEKQQLRQPRDKAFSAYSIARLKLLEVEVICNEGDVKEMEEIRKEIKEAAKIQNLLIAIARLTGFLIAL